MSPVVQATGFPVSYGTFRFLVEGGGFEPPKADADRFTVCSLWPLGNPSASWSWRWDLNPQPADYKSAALPIELRQRPKRWTGSDMADGCQEFFALVFTPGSNGRQEGIPKRISPGWEHFFFIPEIFFRAAVGIESAAVPSYYNDIDLAALADPPPCAILNSPLRAPGGRIRRVPLTPRQTRRP